MKFMKVWLLIGMGFGVVTAPAAELFDMAAIRDASTLDVKVLKDWYPVRGEVMTRQKLITIRVGELVPGKEYRLPVRLIVPHDRKAKGPWPYGHVVQSTVLVTGIPSQEPVRPHEWLLASVGSLLPHEQDTNPSTPSRRA